jgi:hypothetical protein
LEELGVVRDTGEPVIVQKVRAQFARWAAVSLGCFALNLATGIDSPWFLFPAAGMGIGLLTNYAKLWQSGYSWRDVLNRPPAATPSRRPVGRAGAHHPSRGTAPLQRGAQVHRTGSPSCADGKAVAATGAPRGLDTADALCEGLEMAWTLHSMDANLNRRLARIEDRLAESSRTVGDERTGCRLLEQQRGIRT